MTFNKRLTDTSYFPRDPLVLGHKPSMKERYHALVARDPKLAKVKVKDLVKYINSKEKDNDNFIDSMRANDINNKHEIRQFVRNRHQQRVKKILENVIKEYWKDDEAWQIFANATRKDRITFDPNSRNRRRRNKNPDSFRRMADPEKADVDSN